MEPVHTVKDSDSVSNILDQFVKRRQQIFIVEDEFGTTTGLITLEDLIELIVGQFNDEEPEEEYEIIDEYTVVADGSTIIRELNKKLEWDLPEEGAKTLNGLIIDHLNQIPTNNVCIQLEGYKLETHKIESNKVKEVKVSKISNQ